MGALKDNKIFIYILLVVMVVSAVFSFLRMDYEAKADTIDIVLDYNEIEKMADQSDETLSWWLSEFKKMGIDKLGITEESLKSLQTAKEPMEYAMYVDIAKDADWKSEYPAPFIEMLEGKELDDFDVIVSAKSSDMYDFIEQGFSERIDADKFIAYEEGDGGHFFIDGSVSDGLYEEDVKLVDTKGDGYTMFNEASESKIAYINIGLLPEKIEEAEKAGMHIIPRTAEVIGWNDEKFAEGVIKEYERLSETPKYLILAGEAVLGQDDTTKIISDYVVENDIVVGLVENTTQRENIEPFGINDVIEASDYNFTRVFSVWDYIQYRYQYYNYEGGEEITNTLFRAVTERNIRIIYYKPMKEQEDLQIYITDIEDYRQQFSELSERLDKYDISIGDVTVDKPFIIPLWTKILIGIGSGIAALLAIYGILPFKNRTRYILAGLGTLGVVGAFYLMPNFTELLASFASSVAVPCAVTTAMFIYIKSWTEKFEEKGLEGGNIPLSKILITGIVLLVISTLFSLGGGMMTAVPISGTEYMLELEIFRGVKAAQLLPLVFFAGAFIAFFGYKKDTTYKGKLELKTCIEVLNTDIKVWMMLIAAVLLGVGYIYLARTGHESGVEALQIEMIIRNYMEEVLYARPRTKEFLIAFPSVMIFIYCVARRLKLLSFVFGIAAVIGFTSVVNTFMHIRTPLDLSFARTGYSLILGIIFGIIFVLILEGLYRLYYKYKDKFKV